SENRCRASDRRTIAVLRRSGGSYHPSAHRICGSFRRRTVDRRLCSPEFSTLRHYFAGNRSEEESTNMRATDLQGLPRNGALARQTDTANASSATAVAPKRSTTRRKSRAPLDPGPALPAQKLAPFTATEIQAIDTQMWPVHSVVWLQPELRPEAPRSSTLRIERHYKVPAPDFLYFDVPPTSHPDTLEPVADPLPPGVQPQLPQ